MYHFPRMILVHELIAVWRHPNKFTYPRYEISPLKKTTPQITNHDNKEFIIRTIIHENKNQRSVTCAMILQEITILLKSQTRKTPLVIELEKEKISFPQQEEINFHGTWEHCVKQTWNFPDQSRRIHETNMSWGSLIVTNITNKQPKENRVTRDIDTRRPPRLCSTKLIDRRSKPIVVCPTPVETSYSFVHTI